MQVKEMNTHDVTARKELYQVSECGAFDSDPQNHFKQFYRSMLDDK